uniref:Uncharacterized protein n=1 Tax=Arundo donax TaxID=35708 RepID=A0A0A9A5E5_ARUDO
MLSCENRDCKPNGDCSALEEDPLFFTECSTASLGEPHSCSHSRVAGHSEGFSRVPSCTSPCWT